MVDSRLVHIFAAAFDWRILPPYQNTLAYQVRVFAGAHFRGYTGQRTLSD